MEVSREINYKQFDLGTVKQYSLERRFLILTLSASKTNLDVYKTAVSNFSLGYMIHLLDER